MKTEVKEVVVLLVDVSMRNLDLVLSSLFTYVHSAILYQPKTELGLFFFGTQETHNQLNEKMEERGIKGQYLHVMEIKALQSPTTDLLACFENIPAVDSSSDLIDALTVGSEHLNERFSQLDNINEIRKRIFLFSDFAQQGRSLSASFSQQLRRTLNESLIEVEVFAVSFMKKNKDIKTDLSILEDLKGASLSIKEVKSELELLSLFPVKTSNQGVMYNAIFSIGNTLEINIKICKKTQRARMPSFQQHCPKVSKMMEWKRLDDPAGPVPEEFVKKAYIYGAETIIISEEKERSCMYTANKGIELLGFIKQAKIPRHYYLKETYIVSPSTDESSRKGWHLLAEGCRQEKTGMLVRFVFRKNDPMYLAFLTPYEDHNLASDVFIMNIVPFADDMRGFHFGSFSTKESLKPSQHQTALMQELIQQGRLDQKGQDLMNTDNIANPTLHRFYRVLGKRSVNPEAYHIQSDPLSRLLFQPNMSLFGQDFSLLLEKAAESFKKQKVKKELQEYENWSYLPKTESK